MTADRIARLTQFLDRAEQTIAAYWAMFEVAVENDLTDETERMSDMIAEYEGEAESLRDQLAALGYVPE